MDKLTDNLPQNSESAQVTTESPQPTPASETPPPAAPKKQHNIPWAKIITACVGTALAGLLAFVSVSYVNLQEEYNTAINDRDSYQAARNSLRTDIKKLTEDYDKLKKDCGPYLLLTTAEQQLMVELAKQQVGVSQLQGKAASLQSQVDELNGQIAALKEGIVKLSGEPVKYPAGYLYAGKDFAVGRYKIYGGSSNFGVWNAAGRLRVNEILGRNGVEEYIYTFAEGDEVQAGSSFMMVPVE